MYDDKRKAKPDPEIKKYIEKARDISGVSVDPKVCLLKLFNEEQVYITNKIMILFHVSNIDYL